MRKTISFGVIAILLLSLFGVVGSAGATGSNPISGSAFGNTWARTDLPVADGSVSRTWMWGPHADSGPLLEPYVEAPGSERLVQYFDKSRMELTHPNGNPNSIWYVTNGLLAEELITGRMQLGDNSFKQYAPAEVNVAGDLNDPNGPTYATFNGLMQDKPIPNGWLITQTVNRAGQVGNDSAMSAFGVSAMNLGVPTHHDVASVFWNFMMSSGLVYQNGQNVQGALFPNAYYATGYPLTEAYWTSVLVGGKTTQVLVQVFERRVMTYTPSNPAGWQVESGNVGLDYYQWRYNQLGLKPIADPNPPAPWNPPGRSSSPNPTRTTFQTEEPFTGASPAPGVAITDTVSGSCLTPSVAATYRSDAWRCTSNRPTSPTGANFFDPCFSPHVNNPSVVACPDDLNDQQVVILQLTAPLPLGNSPQTGGIPWALSLANGNQCSLWTGAGPSGGYSGGPYLCNGGWFVDSNGIDQSPSLWTATLRWPYQGVGGSPKSIRVAIQTAWY